MYSRLTNVASNVTTAVDEIVNAPSAELEGFIQAPDEQLSEWEEMTANITMSATTTMLPISLPSLIYDNVDDIDLIDELEGSGSTVLAEVSAAVETFNTPADFSDIDALLSETPTSAAFIDYNNSSDDLTGMVACGLMLCLLCVILGWTSRRQSSLRNNAPY